MATIISLKRRIQAAQNVSKTTKAMQMISASKLKKAQSAAVSTRPYVSELDILTHNVVGKIGAGTLDHAYLKNTKKINRTLMIVIGPDKGLCGGLVSNLLRTFASHNKKADDTFYIVIGKKIEGSIARMTKNIVASFPFGTIIPEYDVIYPVAKIIDEYYLGGKVDSVKVLYTHFNSFFSQVPTVSTLLPVKLDESEEANKTSTTYVFEPGAEEILPELLRHHFEMSLYHFFLENFASEQAIRMITMQNATTNANDIIDELRLEYNKTRQSKITSELLDITGAGSAAA